MRRTNRFQAQRPRYFAARQNQTNLDKTTDGKNLAAGKYVMSIVSEGKTASILGFVAEHDFSSRPIRRL
jgi:hypothetical protein